MTSLPEPVRRYLDHVLPDGIAPIGVRLTMAGRIKVGTWLDFTAEQEFAGHAFVWRARAGFRRFKPLHVVDAYGDGAGSTEGRLLGRLRFLHEDDHDTARAAAGRAAAESVWVPGMLLPAKGTTWRVDGDGRIVASVDVPPERAEVTLDVDDSGRPHSLRLLRWGDVGQEELGYIPFGGDIHAERRFGPVVLPSEVTVGWWYGTPRYEPFFRARILSAVQTA